MSGSIAGNVYARNRFGNYARARTKPTNPNTAAQQTVRAAMAQLADRWSQIVTAVQRTAWELYASSVAMQNKLGETVYLTGFNHYMRSNIVAIQAGLTVVDAGPVVFELPDQDPLFAASGSDGTQLIAVTFDDAAAWVDEDDAALLTYQGQPQNPQRNFFNGPWKYMDVLLGDGVTPETTPDDQAAVTVITELQRVWIYGRIRRADGRISEPFRADFFCAA